MATTLHMARMLFFMIASFLPETWWGT
jgi:hypothetical protein